MSNEPITRKEMFMAKASGQNVNTPEPITREEMFLDKIAKNGGKATSWKDLGEKTVMGDTLTWDGDTEGRETFTIGIFDFYHISDVVPELVDLQNGGSAVVPTGKVEITAEMIMADEFGTIGIGTDFPFIFIAPEDNIVSYGVTIPKKGVYFVFGSGGGGTSSFTINGYNKFEKTEITPIPEKYLPSGLGGGAFVVNVVSIGEVIDEYDAVHVLLCELDKTFEEIKNAMKNNEVIVTITNTNSMPGALERIPLHAYSEDSIRFSRTDLLEGLLQSTAILVTESESVLIGESYLMSDLIGEK